MFRNVGERLKTMANILVWVGIVASVAVGFVWAFSGGGPLVGVLCALGGSLFFWIVCTVLYGLGRLIENSELLVKNAKDRK